LLSKSGLNPDVTHESSKTSELQGIWPELIPCSKNLITRGHFEHLYVGVVISGLHR